MNLLMIPLIIAPIIVISGLIKLKALPQSIRNYKGTTYRIIETYTYQGENFFFIEIRHFLFIWLSWDEHIGRGVTGKVVRNTSDSIESHFKKHIDNIEKAKSRKVVT